ncbi:energy-coupling factor transporter transmembrane protein EcfT [uncultured Thalassospira sp.]|jgi:biotin transport system permease protein|uniref:energy-coupling factor transporter transmembrane component T family protein n=1 Tax=uncultured Thalassospira sp. TaxID=404382 RepID=UPI0030D8D06F|tara:strand:- start:2517 stop:3125 length:609 start_codon:yes stop_codon:yes gene_type:complete
MNLANGLYQNRASPLHRLPAGVKVLALVIVGTVVFLINDWPILLAVLAGVTALYGIARFSLRILWAQIKPLIWLLVVFFAVQLWLNDWQAGLVVVTRLASVVLFAGLVTLTTRVSLMLAALERAMMPLRPLGVNPEKVGLAFSLVLRFIPVIASVASEVREAQKARGLDRNMIALSVPLIIHTLKMADDVADAIEARSYDPD